MDPRKPRREEVRRWKGQHRHSNILIETACNDLLKQYLILILRDPPFNVDKEESHLLCAKIHFDLISCCYFLLSFNIDCIFVGFKKKIILKISFIRKGNPYYLFSKATRLNI